MPLAYGSYRDHLWCQRVWSDRAVALGVFEDAQRAGRASIGEKCGLVPVFAELASAGFAPDEVHPRIRDFYESTTDYEIAVRQLEWRAWARPLSLPYGWVSRALGNLRVPPGIDDARLMSSDVRAIDLQDRGSSRAWTRTFAGANELFYAATVRTYVTRDSSYLSLAFPLPRMHLAVVLRIENRPAGGLLLTTRRGGPAGTYIVLPGDERFAAVPGPPTSEELEFAIDSSRVDSKGAEVMTGTHVDRLLGATAFEMRYDMRKRAGPKPPAGT